jgi:predicted PurR-regulated permease PerM
MYLAVNILKSRRLSTRYFQIMNKILLIFILLIPFSGCANISPFKPKFRQEIDNQNGKIDAIKTNQNGIMLDLLNLKNEQQITQRDVQNFQQGLINMEKRNENSGIQIFQGDGGLAIGGMIAMFGLYLIYMYRTRAVASEKTATVLAQQIAQYDDPYLTEEVFKAAMYSPVEGDIYKLITKHQTAVKTLNSRNPVPRS